MTHVSVDGASLQSGDVLSVIGTCDATETLLSGGFAVTFARAQDNDKVSAIQSTQTGPREWTASIVGTANTDVVTVTVTVTCAAP